MAESKEQVTLLRIQFNLSTVIGIERSSTEVFCSHVSDETRCYMGFVVRTRDLYSGIVDQMRQGWTILPSSAGTLFFLCPLHPRETPYPLELLPPLEI